MFGIVVVVSLVLLFIVFLCFECCQWECVLIDFVLFCLCVFGVVVSMQFLLNGVMYVGQMLIFVFLIQVCGCLLGEMGWLFVLFGFGMFVIYLLMGVLMNWFGVCWLVVVGVLFVFVVMLLFVFIVLIGYDLFVFVLVLFLCGMGQSVIGVLLIVVVYVLVECCNLLMVIMLFNIVQWFGGLMFMMLCMLFFVWWLQVELVMVGGMQVVVYVWVFGLLCVLYVVSFVMMLWLLL